MNLVRDVAGAMGSDVPLERSAQVGPELESCRNRGFRGRLLLGHPYDGNGQKFLLAMGINVVGSILFTWTG